MFIPQLGFFNCFWLVKTLDEYPNLTSMMRTWMSIMRKGLTDPTTSFFYYQDQNKFFEMVFKAKYIIHDPWSHSRNEK